MNLTGIIDLKERIATSDAFTPDERDFILACINEAQRKSRDDTVASIDLDLTKRQPI